MKRRSTGPMKRRRPASPGMQDDDPLAVFVRGATVGAFIGAVIAGSTIWHRIRKRATSAPGATQPWAGRAALPVEDADLRRP